MTEYTYDARRNRLSATVPHAPSEPAANFTTTYTYNERNDLTSITLPTGAQMSMTYDTTGNLLAIQDEGGNGLESFAYGPNGVVDRETALFGTTTYIYDASGNVIQSTDVFGNTIMMTYDAAGQLLSMTEDGLTSTFTYDGLGREISADYGGGVSAVYSYGLGPDWTVLDAPTIGHLERKLALNGQITDWVFHNEVQVNFAYDGARRLLKESDALGNATQYRYDAAGRLENVTDATGAKLTMEYDPGGRLVRQTDMLGHATSYTYGPDNRPASMTNALGQTWTYSRTLTTTTIRDPLGRDTTLIQSPHGLPVEVLYNDGTMQSVSYIGTSRFQEAENFPTSATDEEGHVRTFTYTPVGQLKTATDLAGSTYRYGYDKSGLISVVGPTDDTLLFSYSDRDFLEKVTYPDGTVKTVSYGSKGLPATVVLPSGIAVTYEYDMADNLVLRRSSLGEETSFEWDANGALTAVQDKTGRTQYSSDVSGSPVQIDYPSGAHIQYQWDLLGRVVSVTVQASPGSEAFVTTYAYDAIGNLVSVIDPLGGKTVLIYDQVNRLVGRTLPNGVTTSYAYDNRDRLVAIVHRRPDGVVLAAVEYERHGVGEPTRIIREDGSYVLLDYDGALRLVSEAYYDASSTAWQK